MIEFLKNVDEQFSNTYLESLSTRHHVVRLLLHFAMSIVFLFAILCILLFSNEKQEVLCFIFALAGAIYSFVAFQSYLVLMKRGLKFVTEVESIIFRRD